MSAINNLSNLVKAIYLEENITNLTQKKDHFQYYCSILKKDPLFKLREEVKFPEMLIKPSNPRRKYETTDLSEKSNIFAPINKLLEKLEDHQKQREEKKEFFPEEIRTAIEEIKRFYKKYIDDVCLYSAKISESSEKYGLLKERSGLLKGSPRLYGIEEGCCYLLSQQRAREIISLNKYNRTFKHNSYGGSAVKRVNGVYFKHAWGPDDKIFPGKEYAVYALNNTIIQEGSTPTQLLKITGIRVKYPFGSTGDTEEDKKTRKKFGEKMEKKGESPDTYFSAPYPKKFSTTHPEFVGKYPFKKEQFDVIIQASYPVDGPILLDKLKLEKKPEALGTFRFVDPYDFSLNFFLSLCTTPSDGRSHNYIVVNQENNTCKIICIDNDRSIGPLFKKEGTKYRLNFNCCLFFFPQMGDPLNEKFVDYMKKDWTPEERILEWLKKLKDQNVFYEKQLNLGVFDAHDYEKANLPIKITSSSLRYIYQILTKTKSFLKPSPSATHWDLLHYLSPHLFEIYKFFYEKSSDPLDGQHKIFEETGPSRPIYWEDFSAESTLSSPIVLEHEIEQEPLPLLVEWIESLTFNTPKQQQEFLIKLFSTFSDLKTLSLNLCLLDDNVFNSIFNICDGSKSLKVLSIKEFHSLTKDAFLAIIQQRREFHLILGEKHSLNVEDLVDIIQNSWKRKNKISLQFREETLYVTKENINEHLTTANQSGSYFYSLLFLMLRNSLNTTQSSTFSEISLNRNFPSIPQNINDMLLRLFHVLKNPQLNQDHQPLRNRLFEEFNHFAKLEQDSSLEAYGNHSETLYNNLTQLITRDGKIDVDVSRLILKLPLSQSVLQKNEKLKEDIKIRKFALKEKTNDGVQYPPYLSDLLEKGYIHLYDHLMEIQELQRTDPETSRNKIEEKIRNFTFSEISHIVLETRKSIIEKVISEIPPNGKQVLFLLGNTGSGKSTTLCFLRGDTMVLDSVQGHYSSERNQHHLIGHGEISCTFFPNIETINELTIIDFPGFSDSNGFFVSIGIECALKHLVKKYQPKILVFEEITNTAARGDALAKLGRELKRLLGDTANCILGMTKYAQHASFIEIQHIETNQKEELSRPSPEESNLAGRLEERIQVLQESNLPMNDRVKEMQQQLADLKKERENQLSTRLPETKDKQERKKKLADTENTLLRQIGLTQSIALSDLESPEKRIECLDTLSRAKPINHESVDQQDLNADHAKLLENRFRGDMTDKINSQNHEHIDINYAETEVIEASFINFLLFFSYPEIVEFLHVPEIDPKIVLGLSKEIADNSIGKLKDIASKKENISSIATIIREFGPYATPEKVESLQKKLEQVQRYILLLVGIKDFPPLQLDDKWESFRRQHARIKNEDDIQHTIDIKYAPSFLFEIANVLLMGIPFWINNQKKLKEKQIAMDAALKQQATLREELDDALDGYSQALDELYDAFIKLNGIKTIVDNKERIDEALQKFSLSFDSLAALNQSIDQGIAAVKQIYGHQHWDHRVAFLSEKIKNRFPKNFLPFLYLGQNPFLEVLIIQGNNQEAKELLRSTSIINKKALVFEKENKIVVLKEYEKQEKRFDQLVRRSTIPSLQIETINRQTNSEIDSKIEQSISQFKRETGIKIETPLFQMLIRSAIKPLLILENNCFLEEKLVEKSKNLFQTPFKFGKAKWEEYFGDIGEEPPLPPNIEEILDHDCRFFQTEKVRNTHLLMLIPKKVNGEDFNLDYLQRLIKEPKKGNGVEKKGYYNIDVQKEIGRKGGFSDSYWVLITRDIIPRSDDKKKDCDEENFFREGPYRFPRALEAATAILMYYLETGERLYPQANDKAKDKSILTCCNEQVDGSPVAVGYFGLEGLAITVITGPGYGPLGCVWGVSGSRPL